MNPLNNLPGSRNTVVQRNSSGPTAFKWSEQIGRVTTCETPSHHARRPAGAERGRAGNRPDDRTVTTTFTLHVFKTTPNNLL